MTDSRRKLGKLHVEGKDSAERDAKRHAQVEREALKEGLFFLVTVARALLQLVDDVHAVETPVAVGHAVRASQVREDGGTLRVGKSLVEDVRQVELLHLLEKAVNKTHTVNILDQLK